MFTQPQSLQTRPTHAGLPSPPIRWSIRLLVTSALLAALPNLHAEPQIDFSHQILPILSDNCFACHGPDEKARKAKLRLDLEEPAKHLNVDGEAAVVPGDVTKSLLIHRVVTADDLDRMPPPKTGKQLTPDQIDLLTRWVQQGAPYTKHWAFTPPRHPPLPEAHQSDWPQNEVDHFVLARLEQEAVAPAPPAERRTLARRVTLDLTGLPPTPQEIDAFLADESPQAYEQLVDRLLQSPRYGENMARYWMDAARYADSHGFHIDAERHLWKWRDWVINAFNRNLPFDEFTVEQIAGDLLPNATTEQKVASGFIRANMSTGEGGAIEDEYLAKYTFDRTETTSTIWLGLTLTCARCHSHKYDPISQREYYGLYTFFNNLDESIMDGNRPNPDPFLKLPTPEQQDRQAWLKQHLQDAQTRLAEPRAELDVAEEVWRQGWRDRLLAGLVPLQPHTITAEQTTPFQTGDDGTVELQTNAPTTAIQAIVLRPTAGRIGGLRLEFPPSPPSESPQTLRLGYVEAELVEPAKDGQPGATRKLKFAQAFATSWIPDHDPSRILDSDANKNWSPASTDQIEELFLRLDQPLAVPENSELRLRLHTASDAEHRPPHRFRVTAATAEDLLARLFPPAQPPWKLLGPFRSTDPESGLAQTFPPEENLDFDQTFPGVREEIRWNDRGDLPDGQRHLLVNELHGVHGVYYLTRIFNLEEATEVEFTLQADDVFKLWIDGQLAGEQPHKAALSDGPLRLRRALPSGEHRLLVKIANLQGPCYFSFNWERLGPPLAPPDIAGRLLVTARTEPGNSEHLRRYFRRQSAPDWRELDVQAALWRQETEAIDQSIVTTMVAKERNEPRETHLLMRGEYDKPGDIVTAGVPAILPPLPDGAPTNRLGLARWLVNPDHPLTARVTVNRLWQQLFGIGLVKTAEDFGVQGERPSHPELLDWLATEFVASGWNVKHLLRLMVTSATYRQDSAWRQDLATRDPENRWLARGTRFRLDGEVLRDTALAVSGLLVEQLGGKSVKPYEPPGLWEAVSFNNSQKYVQDIGDANYRRSLYTHWKRQSPPPNMLLFDAPSREYCVVRRPRTNTPLQALALLNDPQFVEASRALACRIVSQGGTQPDDRIRFGFELVTGRRPNEEELQILLHNYQAQLADFQEHPADAEALLSVGAFRPPVHYNPAELATWATLASMLLNLDATLTKG